MKRILVVEDDVLIRLELVSLLEKEGYEVLALADFSDTVDHILASKADLVLLDLNLPQKNGFQICRELKTLSSLPILVLTSRENIRDEIKALKLGADEYITKPFRKDRLLVRIENVLKRYEGRANLLERRGFLLDRTTYTLYLDGRSQILPQNQGKLLEALLLSEDEILTKEELSMVLWNTAEFIDENALQVNMTRLKKLLRELGIGYHIETVRGVGYRLIEGVKVDED